MDSARGSDVVRAGPGTDAVAAGRGRDRVFGGAGNDFIVVRHDGLADLINCGRGHEDRVYSWRRLEPMDRTRGCEIIGID